MFVRVCENKIANFGRIRNNIPFIFLQSSGSSIDASLQTANQSVNDQQKTRLTVCA